MKTRFTNEVKVGIFFFLCLAGLIYLTVGTGKLDIKSGGYHIYVVFDDIAGLDIKAPVMLNGRQVGKVEEINIAYDDDETKIVLKVWLNDQAKIRDGAVVAIKTLGLMGEKFIQISSNKGDDFIKPGATLSGRSLMDMDVIMDEAQRVSKEVCVLVNNVNALTDEVKKLAVNINTTVSGNQDKISQIVDNLEKTSENLQLLTEDVKRNPWKLLHKGKERKSVK